MFKNSLRSLHELASHVLPFVSGPGDYPYAAVHDGRFNKRLKSFSDPEYPLALHIEPNASTRLILSLLRQQSGTVFAPAGTGKTTALLMYANELRAHGTVTLVVPDKPFVDRVQDIFADLFHKRVGDHILVTPVPQRFPNSNFVLVDEVSQIPAHTRMELNSGRCGFLAGEVSRCFSSLVTNDREVHRAERLSHDRRAPDIFCGR